jgi:hypothetical protein
MAEQTNPSDRPVKIHAGNLLWLGEHWINALRPEASAIVSLFHTRYSPAGEGNGALVRIGGEGGFHAVCTDQPELGRFLTERFFRRVDYFQADLPTVPARFRREGDVRRDPAWVIETDRHRIVARWKVAEPPVIADGTFRSGTEHFTVLFFTDEASVELDGKRVEGRPYPRDIWKPSVGGERSSCVFALAETLIELPPAE